MFLKNLKLRNFRNFSCESFELSESVNLIMGKNAQGKTNLIEAINCLIEGNSFRTSRPHEIVFWGEASTIVEGEVERYDGCGDVIKLNIIDGKKYFEVNGKRKMHSLYNGAATVIFSPEDILLLRNSPSARRNYLDSLIARFETGYRRTLKEYEKIVSQRNRILIDAFENRSVLDQLDIWDQRLIAVGSKVLVYRATWVGMIDSELPVQYSAIAPSDGRASIEYASALGDFKNLDVETISSLFSERLIERRADEVARGYTLVGPHRDDILVKIGSKPLKEYGSQGQLRTTMLALKISELELYKKRFGHLPLLLLDDVLSELDEERSRFLLDYLSTEQGQVLVTTTDTSSPKLWSGMDPKIFTIENGKRV